MIFQNLTEKLQKKELDYTQLEEKHNEECMSKKSIQASLHQKDLDCQQLQSRLSASETSLQRIQAELGEKGEATQKLKEELSEVETKYQHLKAEFKQLQQQRAGFLHSSGVGSTTPSSLGCKPVCLVAPDFL